MDGTGNLFDQMWLIEPVPEEADMYYTMRNLTTGLYAGVYQGRPFVRSQYNQLGLKSSKGNTADGTFVVGYKQVYNYCVQWIIRNEDTDGTSWR